MGEAALRIDIQYNSSTVSQRPYTVHYKTHQGRKHLVVPVVIMVEGVHSGSAGPVFHSAGELSKYPECWNGIPVVIGHPSVNGADVSANSPDIIDSQVVGRVYNTHFTSGKLKAEAWLDEARTTIVDKTIITHLLEGKPLDISMGAYTDDEPANGTWNGESYIAKSHNYRPDHLALLPQATGACSWADGCGVRTNEANTEMGGLSMDKQLWLGMLEAGLMVAPLPDSTLQSNSLGYREVTRAVQDKLNQLDNAERENYLEEVYEDNFIYRVSTRGNSTLYKRGYAISEAGELTLGNDPTEVIRRVEYTEVGQAQTLQTKTFVRTKGVVEEKPMATNEKKVECTPCEKVEQLIQLNHFDAEDKTWLSKLGETELDRLLVVHTAIKPVEVKKEEAKVVETKAEPIQMNEEQVMAALSPETRQQMEYGMKLFREHRDGLVERITTNSKVYSKEDLTGMDTPALEKLAQVIKPVANYALSGAGTTVQTLKAGEAPLLPPGVKVSESK